MSEPDIHEVLTPIYDGFREDYFLAWLEGYGLFCIPNFVARVQDGELVLHLLEHVSDEDIAEIRRRMGDADYRVAESRLSLAEIEKETGFKIPE
jgi:hypothetical protein